ncbi:MAG: histidine kinase [Flavobacterium sp.]|uniref:tetratricopeptide repeat-containing sensor histidine kinase n=1 Tax=Flavobacterium sp. Leaf359 TaxID=1736351 RepID=UPI000701FC43|nr:histidine kinase [Flavobacterium sp. Leaf359]KQS46354.1 regulator of cell autolysis [Flavobacterium sp. Leaf359]MBU7570738.1 histidine kinase [Flavobacterium sp.]PZQ85350.1 MAG: regulator of cell autolysis [Flavobacterium johnsoniae]
MMKTKWTFFFFLLLFGMKTVMAQDTIKKKSKQSQKEYNLNQAAAELKKSLSEDENDLQTAQKYEALAKQLSAKGQYAKAEEYLKKARDIYAKRNKKKEAAITNRGIAKVQESQNKTQDAIVSYEMASQTATDKVAEKINYNDAERLKNSAPEQKKDYISSNIQILEKEGEKEEAADAYQQMAKANIDRNDAKAAIENYKKALENVKHKPEEAIKIKNEIAKVYASENEFDKAIEINKKLINEAKEKNDSETQIVQMQELAAIYFKQQEAEKGISVLKKAYELAIQNGKTILAKNSLDQLISEYNAKGNGEKSIELYENFFENFESLIKSDNSLVDSKVFQVTEDRIKHLEKERALKDELISKKNTFNYFLLGSVVLMVLLFVFIVKALYSIKTKNKKIALQSLRREMNPHFIFNSLNSVNQFISENKELEANKYLTSYSNLMRNMMENSNKDFVTLNNEVEQLKKYLDLEHLRFNEKFDYEITIDDALDGDAVLVPNMLLQPHLENAIWHGLRYKEGKGFLKLDFKLKNNIVKVIVDDNGIGLAKSKELKTTNQKVHESRGMTNTRERISLLNELYKKNISLKISEKENPETGTRIEISFPLIDRI